MKRLAFLFASFLLASQVSGATVHAVYRIALRDGSHVLSKDRPERRGSVMLFHRYPDGVLTSLPEEDVLGVRTNVESSRARPLEPGEEIDVGVTAGNANSPAAGQPASTAASTTLPGGVYDPRNPSYGGAYSSRIPPGDLARAISGAPPTAASLVGPNGFPATPGSTMTIGPNGTPILVPGSTPPVIGPNGTPTLAPPGTPGLAQPSVGPNGYPSR